MTSYSEAAVELSGVVALNIWRNLFNTILKAPIDFPLVEIDQPAPGANHAEAPQQTQEAAPQHHTSIDLSIGGFEPLFNTTLETLRSHAK